MQKTSSCRRKDWQHCRVGVSNNLLQRQSVIFPTNLFLSFQFSTQPLSVIGPCLLVLIFVCWSEVLRLHKKSISISIRAPQKVPRLANAQCAFCQVCFPSNRTSWDISQKLRLDKLFNIYLSLLVRLEGKHDFEGNRDFQTLNLGFPGHFDRFWVFQK